jgi:ribosomal protein L13E
MRITTDEPLSAVIYDAELDTIEVVRHLDTYRGFRVVKLDRAGLELEGGGQRIGLRMDTDGAPGRGGAP